MPYIEHGKTVLKCPHCEQSSYHEKLAEVAVPVHCGDPHWVFDIKRYRLILNKIEDHQRIVVMRWVRKEFEVDLGVVADVVKNQYLPAIICHDLDQVQADKYIAQAEELGLPIELKAWRSDD
jgi:hypothetical protein